MDIAKSFCLKRNSNELMKVHKDGLDSMYGMRFITAGLVIVLHHIIFINSVAVINGLDFEKV